jgi:zinc protease
MFELEADRMANALIAPEEFAKEIRVVMEERRLRTEDQPRAALYEELMAAALRAHPYRVPTIGWMNDLENTTAAEARAFYEAWYAPNNATVVVVGDVSADEVVTLAERYFGAIKPHPLPVRKPQVEPPQKGIRRIVVKAPAEQPYMIMAWHTPQLLDAVKDWEPYALDMLASVLDGNAAARFSRELVRGRQIATAVNAGYDGVGRGPAFFSFSGVPAAGQTVATLEAALREQLRKIVDEGVTEDELTRIKSQETSARVFQRDSMFFQARQIGSLEMAGISHKLIDTMDAKFKAVTADQVREVARKYLIDDALTVAVLDPQPMAARKPAALPAGGHYD